MSAHVDFCMEGVTYHTYVRFCCQSQVQITYIACVRCILGAAQSHMIINQKGMRIFLNTTTIQYCRPSTLSHEVGGYH